ncbi:hypothetical protein F4819DRAFT_455526 [Hypoxylon fuscum]|nr:hypothetical protein F4819DRAFT_455526 [Hypoxylon fuscum]
MDTGYESDQATPGSEHTPAQQESKKEWTPSFPEPCVPLYREWATYLGLKDRGATPFPEPHEPLGFPLGWPMPEPHEPLGLHIQNHIENKEELDLRHRYKDMDTGYKSDQATASGVPTLTPAQQESKLGINRRSVLRVQRRKVLPILFEKDGMPFSILACPDTGSDDNIISLEMARCLGLPIEPYQPTDGYFCMANGRAIRSVGIMITNCSFGTGTPCEELQCVFHVFSTLAVPLIMGLQFLELTETWTRHRDRLVEEATPTVQVPRVCSVGGPKKSLACDLDGYASLANVDTGSDLDFVSEAYARARGFHIEESSILVMFADGSTGLTCGVIRTAFAVRATGDVKGESLIDIDFFVLAGLSSDVLIGQDTIEKLNIFTVYSDSFVPSIPRSGEPDINIIRYIGKMERKLKKKLHKMRNHQAEVPGMSIRAAIFVPTNSCLTWHYQSRTLKSSVSLGTNEKMPAARLVQ